MEERNMKKIYLISAVAFSLALLASCDGLNTVPVFDDADSFASLTVSSQGIDENGGQLVIPVQVASTSPLKTSVAYEIVEGTAKKSVDFKDTNTSGVLTFSGGDKGPRVKNIVIDIINRDGEYTGDVTFTINLVSATGINIGAEKSCKVTIYDLDHPLADILGKYSATCTDVSGPMSFELELLKDPKDPEIVWCNHLCPTTPNTFNNVYARVEGEKGNRTLIVPTGQVFQENYQDDGAAILYICINDGGYYIDDTNDIVFTQTPTGFVTENGYGYVTDRYLWYGGFVYGKESGDYITVWTKK